MKRWICFLLAVFLLSTLLCLSAAGETVPDKIVFDRANLFDDAELRAVKESVFAAWEASDCAFYLATHHSSTTVYIGDRFLQEQGLSASQNIVLLVITLDDGEYFYDLYTYGNAYSRISQKEVDYILDHDAVYDNLKTGRLVEGVDAFMQLSAQAFEGRVGVSYTVIGVISFILATIIGVVSCVSVHTSYKMKKKSVDYPLDRFAKLELREQSDVFTGSFVTKRVIQTNNGGRGGSSHGGGGGHRGGR